MIASILGGLGFTALCTLTALALVLWYFDPTSTGNIGPTLFFVSFFGSVASILNFLLIYLRSRKTDLPQSHIWVSLRQGTVVSLLLTGFLILAVFDLFQWWHPVVAILLLLVVEIYLKIRLE